MSFVIINSILFELFLVFGSCLGTLAVILISDSTPTPPPLSKKSITDRPTRNVHFLNLASSEHKWTVRIWAGCPTSFWVMGNTYPWTPQDTTKAGKGLIVMHKCVYLMHHTGAWHARPQILASPAGVELGPNIWLYLYVCAYVCMCVFVVRLFYFIFYNTLCRLLW